MSKLLQKLLDPENLEILRYKIDLKLDNFLDFSKIYSELSHKTSEISIKHLM